MAVNWTGFYTELQTNIGAAWPEVIPPAGGGIWDLNALERLNQKRVLKFNYAALSAVAAPSGDWGLVNSAFEVRVEFYYIKPEPSGLLLVQGQAALRDTIDLLRARILHPGNFTTATVLDVDEVDWSLRNPAMSVFIAMNIPFEAGGLSATFVIGETIT